MTTKAAELTGRELDAAVHRALTGECPHQYEFSHTEHCQSDTAYIYGCVECGDRVEGSGKAKTLSMPHYSTDIAAAWKVVEAMDAKGYAVELRRHFGDATVLVSFSTRSYDGPTVTAPTAPEAICRAALKVLEAR